tara:strand:- start:4329 stop:4652 length:324 start_codon:yes stop_codon:yes gene_type:complete
MSKSTVVNQLPLSTTRQVVHLGPDKYISYVHAANSDASAAYHVVLYLIPAVRSSSTKSEHILWYADVASKSTGVMDFSNSPVRVPTGWSLEAVAEANNKITLNVMGF